MGNIIELKKGETLNRKDYRSTYLRDRSNKVSFVCDGCHETKSYSLATYFKKLENEKTLCHECTIAKRKLERYGEAGYCNPNKIRQTTKERYGVDNISQLQKVKDEKERKSFEKYGESQQAHRSRVGKQTCLERYGDANYGATRCKEILMERYGVNNIQHVPGVKEKTRETAMRNGGFTWQRESAMEKVRATNLVRYGNEVYQHTDEFKEIQRKSFKDYKSKLMLDAQREKYGGQLYVNSPEGIRKRYHKYEYDGEKFDSSWELAYWIYQKHLGNDIARYEKSVTLSNGSRWYPDFIVNGKVVEIKGDHFMKDTFKVQRIKLKIEKATELGIDILVYKDLKESLDYVASTYGKGFLKSKRLR